MEEGWLSDALEFYQKAAHYTSLTKIKDMALSNGDVMLFQQAAKVLGMEIKPADRESIAEKAVELKKYFFAKHALQKANNEEKLKTLREIMEKEVNEKSS